MAAKGKRARDPRERVIFLVILGVIAAFAVAVIVISGNRFTFEGMEEVEARLAAWTPGTAQTAEAHPVEGGVLYYGIDCCGYGDSYRGEAKALRRFYKSDIRSADEIGVIVVFYFDRHGRTTYKNGATAYSKDCDVYLLEPDTLRILAKSRHSVLGGSVPSTTSGGDRYGSKPSLSECRAEAQRLLDKLNGG